MGLAIDKISGSLMVKVIRAIPLKKLVEGVSALLLKHIFWGWWSRKFCDSAGGWSEKVCDSVVGWLPHTPTHDSVMWKFCGWVVKKILQFWGWVVKKAILGMSGTKKRVWTPPPLTFLMQ